MIGRFMGSGGKRGVVVWVVPACVGGSGGGVDNIV